MTEGPCSRASSNIITGCKYCSRDLLFIWEQSNERWAAAPASAGMPMALQQEPAALGKGQGHLNVCVPLQTLSFSRKKYPAWLANPIPPHDASAVPYQISIGVIEAPAGLRFVVKGRGGREVSPDPACVAQGKPAQLCPSQEVRPLCHHGWALCPSLALLVLPAASLAQGTAWSIPAPEHPCASSCT